MQSPPAREAWIEIAMQMLMYLVEYCRLPQGRRGLKSSLDPTVCNFGLSPPAREAWIEIIAENEWEIGYNVASRKGGVD